jgi:hypothetical protein
MVDSVLLRVFIMVGHVMQLAVPDGIDILHTYVYLLVPRRVSFIGFPTTENSCAVLIFTLVCTLCNIEIAVWCLIHYPFFFK